MIRGSGGHIRDREGSKSTHLRLRRSARTHVVVGIRRQGDLLAGAHPVHRRRVDDVAEAVAVLAADHAHVLVDRMEVRRHGEAVKVRSAEGARLDEFGFAVVSLASSPPLLLAQDPRHLLLMADGDSADGAMFP